MENLIHKKNCDINSNIGIPKIQKDESYCSCNATNIHEYKHPDCEHNCTSFCGRNGGGLNN